MTTAPTVPAPQDSRASGAVTIVIPSYNEVDNVDEMVNRLDAVFAEAGVRPEVLYVDDSSDGTAQRVRDAAGRVRHVDLRVLQRHRPVGGLAGAVVDGLREARGDVVVVMDADLQHPPEAVPSVLAAFEDDVDVVVASRYMPGGSNDGLDGRWRASVSSASTLLARSLFPRRLRRCSDPMTGFFAVRRDRVDTDLLRPRGFKILLELLVSQPLWVEQVPLAFTARSAGTSKASPTVALQYLRQLLSLRFRNRALRFAAVGAFGTVVNLVLMAALMAVGMHYLPASLVSAEVTIVMNFLIQEAFVFGDLRGDARGIRSGGWWRRLVTFGAFNNAELAVRTPLLVLLVEAVSIPAVVGQAVLLAFAFALRFVFTRYVVYRHPHTVTSPGA